MAQMLSSDKDEEISSSNSMSDLSAADSLASGSSDIESLADKNSCSCKNQSPQTVTSCDSHSNQSYQKDQSYIVASCCNAGQSGCCKINQSGSITENDIMTLSKINLNSKKPDAALLDF